jgi:molybdenum cofactor sulfurtransferase
MSHGLCFDREWMLVEPGTGMALSQKVHTGMALIRPVVDLVRRRLRVSVPKGPGNDKASFDVGLDEEDVDVQDDEGFESPPFLSQGRRVRVCSESVEPLMYPPSHPSSRILTDFLGIPCPRPPAFRSFDATRSLCCSGNGNGDGDQDG